jgi:hypothetical protein
MARGTAAELARLAGENRYRIMVTADKAPTALGILLASGLDSFTACPAPEAGWTLLEGEVRGGAASCAEVTRRLAAAGIAVAELARIPLSLADLIERLVERGVSA